MKNEAQRKVLVVVRGGMAYAYAEPGVRVAIADMDNLAVPYDNEQVAIHDDFRNFLVSAGLHYPTNKDAPANQAKTIDAPAESRKALHRKSR